MIKTIYSRALSVLMKKPLKLWGISLLSIFLCSVFTYLCGVAIPGLALAISVLMTTSMTMIYLSGYRGENVQTVQLFSCFKDWQTIKRVVLGMGWMILPCLSLTVNLLTRQGFYLLLAGGIAYTVGAVLYGIGSKVRWMHSLFHIFVVQGSLLQFLAIFFYVL